MTRNKQEAHKTCVWHAVMGLSFTSMPPGGDVQVTGPAGQPIKTVRSAGMLQQALANRLKHPDQARQPHVWLQTVTRIHALPLTFLLHHGTF